MSTVTDQHQKAWQAVHEYESKARRKMHIAKVKNPVLAIIYVFNSLLMCLYLSHALVKTPDDTLVSRLPLMKDFIKLMDGYIEGSYFKMLLCSIMFIGVIAIALGIVLHVILACVIHKKPNIAPALPEGEENQIRAIREKCEQLEKELVYSDPSMWMFGLSVLFVGIGYVLYLVMMHQTGQDADWVGVLFLALVMCVVMFGNAVLGVIAMTIKDTNEIEKEYKNKQPQQPEKTVPVAQPVVINKEEPVQNNEEKEVDPKDSFTWTEEYVRANETKCSEMAALTLEVAKDVLRERDYELAGAALDRVVYALELLSCNPGGEIYMSSLYASLYAASKVYAFGVQDRDAALFRLKQAVITAGKYALKELSHSDRAARDFEVMKGVLDEFESGASLSRLADIYGNDFPNDVING